MDANTNEGSEVGSQPIETNINVSYNTEINCQIVYQKPVGILFNNENEVHAQGRLDSIISSLSKSLFSD
jgi:hypothetical protein